MKPITAPLKLGQTGSEVVNLQEILLMLINESLLSIEGHEQLIDRLAEEREKQLLGSGTYELVNIFKTTFNIDNASGPDAVNAATVAALNAELDTLMPPTFRVSGKVVHSSGKQLSGSYNASIELLGLSGPVELATVPVSADGGYYYSLAITPMTTPVNLNETNGVRVVIRNDVSALALAKQDVYSAGGDITINFTLDSADVKVVSEFDAVQEALQVALVDVAISAVDPADENALTLLADKTGESKERIRHMILAVKMHQDVAAIAPETAYALLRRQMPETPQALVTQTVDSIYNALKVAVATDIIPEQNDSTLQTTASGVLAAVAAHVMATINTQDPAESGLYQTVLDVAEGNGTEAATILNVYNAHIASGDGSLEDALSYAGIAGSRISQFEKALQVLLLTGNNAFLSKQLLAIMQDTQANDDLTLPGAGEDAGPSLLSKLTIGQWEALIEDSMNNESFFFPEFITGATPDIKKAAYAQFMELQFDLTYPMQATVKAITADAGTPFIQLKANLEDFLADNPGFDLRNIPVNTLSTSVEFEFGSVDNKVAFIEEAGIVQRLMNVTENQQLISAMAADGLHSAMQISRQSPTAFVAAYQTAAGGEAQAQDIYDAATQQTGYIYTAILEYAGQLNSQPAYALSQSDGGNALAEWRALFGSIDSCNCSQCQSVYSPAAYLTDLLQFIKNNLPDAYDELMARRPDIKDIDLVCNNINTTIPHIDIVNELLEDLVSAVGYNQLQATTYINDSYRLYARQTIADAATQRALPEYVNTFPGTGMKLRTWSGSSYQDAFVKNPYDKIKDAVYPSVLPYNFYKRQIDAHLGLTGVKSYELRQRFSDVDRMEAWDDPSFTAAYLGISDEELNIITIEENNPYRHYGLQINAVYLNGTTNNLYYVRDPKVRGGLYPAGEPFMTEAPPGGTTFPRAAWTDQLAYRVDVFLQQAQLSYAELRTILDCYCINPWTTPVGRKLSLGLIDPATAGDACDLSRYKINGLDLSVVRKLYRFVRLKKALGWSYYDLDQALISLSGIEPANALSQAGSILINSATVKHLAQIERLSKQLGLPVSTIILLWKDIDDIFIYTDYEQELTQVKTIYKQMFRDTTAGNINDANYPFSDGALSLDLTTLNSTRREEFHNYLSGIWGIGASDLSLLIRDVFPSGIIPAGYFNLVGISSLYREVILLKALNIPVTEWLQYRNWITLNVNFNATSTPLSNSYERTASPFTSPYDALRFLSFVKAGKEAGISIAETGYLLLDAFQEPVEELAQNEFIAKSLTSLRAGLQKNGAPDYTSENDADGNILKGIVQLLVHADTADYLIKVIHNDPEISADLQSDRVDFLMTSALAFSALQAQSLTDYVTESGVRRQQVYTILKPLIENAARRPFIINFLAGALKVDEQIITVLMDSCVTVLAPGGAAVNAANLFLSNEFINSDAAIERTESISVLIPQFIAYVRLQKAAWLISKFRLDLQDIISLWSEDNVLAGVFSLSDLPVAAATGTAPVPGTATEANVPYYQWLGFLRWMEVIAFLGKNKNLLQSALRSIPEPVPATMLAQWKERTLKGIGNAFSMPLEDLIALLGTISDPISNGALNVAFNAAISVPNNYNSAALYLRIMSCLEIQHLLPSPMSALVKAAGAVATPDSQEKANEIIQIVKSQYEEDQWLQAIRPVNDLLRTERRDAMLGYLLHYRPYKYRTSWYTANDIFETLMVDVEMMSCMSTTRVLLAVNTIQLWVDRILLGLEKYTDANGDAAPLVLGSAEARQWNMWRKLYRVWEANRKIFLYPENWIEPELRDDKSPFFKELEKFLKQNELTGENVEEAYRTYLERLEEVAHLEVIGICREIDAAGRIIIHAFGRTASNPHIYFYRKRIDTEWLPWEKMDVQIDGDHFIPVVWRGRLRFYWLTFMKEQLTEQIPAAKSGDDDQAIISNRWKINLAFTEYKNKTWMAKQISRDVLYSTPISEEGPTSLADIRIYTSKPSNSNLPVVHLDKKWYLKGTLEKQRFNRLIIYASSTAEGDLQLSLTEVLAPITQKDMFDKFFSGFTTVLGIKIANPYPIDFQSTLNMMIEQEFYSIKQVIKLGIFTHKYNGIVASNSSLAQRNLYADEMLQLPSTYRKDLASHSYSQDFTRYAYSKPGLYNTSTAVGYTHFPDATAVQPLGINLLNKAPDQYLQNSNKPYGKYLIFPLQKPEGYQEGNSINFPAFFYTDYNNNFFVEKVHVERKVLFTITIYKEDSPIQYGKVSTLSPKYSIRYHFQEFSHGQVEQFREQLYKNGLDEFLKRDFISGLNDGIAFAATYQPTSNVLKGTDGKMYPNNKVDFSLEGAYALYNWELFYHIPMLIANKLTQDQKFDEARKWYHYVFNPTVGGNSITNGSGTVEKFWNFPVFFDSATSIPSPLDVMGSDSLATAVARWAADPFKPHLVARTRVSAYMKNTVMKYLDNLIAWADMLFRTDTRENINEATLLYVLAAQLLGRKPAQIAANDTPVVQTYISLVYATAASGGLNAFSNGVVKAENLNLVVSTGATKASVLQKIGVLPVTPDSMFYFCLPPNDKLAGYWDTLADRLFKIRNCRNIDGIERELALFDPPIDPALLVKAAAAGLSLSEALADINAPLPAYRFNVMAQKATELTQEVKSLGSQMLSALEKKDAEHLSLLRGSQELTMLSMVTEVKEQQVADAVAQINGLQQQKKMTTQRRDYYKRLVDTGLNTQEQLQLDSLQTSIPLQIKQGSAQTLAAILAVIPNFKIGSPTTVGATFGGANLSSIANAAASALSTAASINSIIGQMAGTKGSYARRKEEWVQQLKTAETELKQLDYQILAAQIRQAVSEMELRNHKVQMANAQQMDEAMRNKYTNEELYEWMVSELSATYFQAYKLAMDVARRAERCYRYELGIESSDFIQPSYWDSLKKGLLAGEQLMYDLKRMDVAFLEKNKRNLELTKHISLAQLCPDDLLKLKTDRKCDISLPEWIFDMDYPGQHLRRIKSVSISIPCVTGPYTTISCKLSLVSSKYRKSGIMHSSYEHEDNFKQLYGSIQSIATSHAQNDSGMFEFSFRDERYLPFEGAGAISKWRIELPAVYAQFDYEAISDVILHVNYTALDEGGLKVEASENVTAVLASAAQDNGFMRLFSLKKEFPNEWFAYGSEFESAPLKGLEIKIEPGHFPAYSKNRIIEVLSLQIGLNAKTEIPANYRLQVSYRENNNIRKVFIDLAELASKKLLPVLKISGKARILKLVLTSNSSNTIAAADAESLCELLNDLYIVAHCRLSSEPFVPDTEDDAGWSVEPEMVADDPDPLDVPVLTANPGNTLVNLTWNAVNNADSYIVQRSWKSTFPSYATVTVYNGPLLAATVSGLQNGKMVYFRVSALGNGFYPDSAFNYTSAMPSFNEPPAIADMLGWWRSDQGVSHQGGLVTAWADQSGNDRTVTPLNPAASPSYIAGVVENGVSQGAMLKLATDLNIGKVYTLSFVVRQDVLYRELLGLKGIYSSGSSYGIYFGPGSTFYHAPRPGAFVVTSATALSTTGYHSYRIARDNFNLSFYCDGLLVGTATTVDNADFIIDNLYGEDTVYSFAGGIKDIIIYDKLLSTQEQAQLDNYLDVAYGL